MEGGSGSNGAGGRDGDGSWFEPRSSVKVSLCSVHQGNAVFHDREDVVSSHLHQRNFSTMAASHRDDSPDSLFLPPDRDPHYNNEHSTRRRRMQAPPERQRERVSHFPGDGLDLRRPVMSNAREQSEDDRAEDDYVNEADVGVAAPAPVIDLTDEIEDGNEGMGWRGEAQRTGQGEVNMPAGSAHATGRQRLPRFGREVIDVEVHNQDNLAHFRPRAVDADDNDDDDVFADLPGANFLALPPRRSASGRVQYSTLRRPARLPSPPQEMDDEEIEYVGTRSFRYPQMRVPNRSNGPDDLPAPQAHYVRPRSVTPYPGEPHAPVAIDLTDDANDDDVQFVNARRVAGVNRAQPDLNAGNRTEVGEPGGFGIGRLANILRDGGAAIGGRLAQRVQNMQNNNNTPFGNLGDEELRARRARLEQQLQESARRRDEEMRELARLQAEGERGVRTPAPPRHRHRHHFVPRVRQNANGTLRGYARVGWQEAGVPRPAPYGLGNLNIGGMMDYGLAAFDMGLGGAADNRPPTPKYSPPPETDEGFTRNPGEDEIVVCPNCGDELAVGDEEAKQEIWVIKGCGHVSWNPFCLVIYQSISVADFSPGILWRLRPTPRQDEEQEGQGPCGRWSESTAAVQELCGGGLREECQR